MRVFCFGQFGTVLDAYADKYLVLFDGYEYADWVPVRECNFVRQYN